MNFLAHLQVADRTPESWLGNLLGDFVKGLPWDDRFSVEIWRGIMEHRYIDAFTDSHEVWKRSRDRMRPENRRFAGIVVDIFYDHFLIYHWDKFSPDEEMEEFLATSFGAMQSLQHFIPEEAGEAVEWITSYGWIDDYLEIEGIDDVLRRVSQRSRSMGRVIQCQGELERSYREFEQDFLEFYPLAREAMLEIRQKVLVESGGRKI
ncbi:MAG: ACP phosphodiesterase [Verrucomicrobiota bacterium]